MIDKKVLWAGTLVVALLLGVYGAFRPAETIVQREVKEIQQSGAVSGPDLNSPYWTVNGFERRYYSSQLRNATSTICSFITPEATSTLSFVSAQITTGTTSVIALEIAKDTPAGGGNAGTTTRLAYTTLSSLQKVTLATGFSTTTSAISPGNWGATDLTSDFIFKPSSYLNVRFGGTRGDVNVLKGTCKAEFVVN